MDPHVHQLYHKPVYFPGKAKSAPGSQNPSEFKRVLKSQEELKVSKHAEERLTTRNISLTKHQWQLINEKVNEAEKKGITDSLVVTDKAALLVSVKNRTVVTAMNRQEATNKIFTNINGTILIEE